MEFIVQDMTKEAARQIATWKYPTPYAMYDLSEADLPTFHNPAMQYFTIYDLTDTLIGYCCFGAEAQVPGGKYAIDDMILDIGVGMNPDYVGKGYGKNFIHTILAFAHRKFCPERFRVTIAGFNERSLRAFQSLGFRPTHQFRRTGDGLEFTQLERKAAWDI